MNSPNKKWNAKFGFFWYNDDELFRFTREDFDEKARKIADSGINIVMTFSCTHFRWTFHRYWDRILQCLAMTVEACHKYGIKVVEHHSSHLTFNPLNDEHWDYTERILNARGSSLASWEGLADHINDDIMVSGKPISSFRQIDGRTGEHARSNYNGYCMCFNNPDYRNAYFDYLEKVYATGVDGIMTDDVQYFGMGHACACMHCQRLFSEETGLAMPAPGEEWHRFWGDYDNPGYIAWERFRRRSTENFQRQVNAHFKSLGLNLLRPNYVSGAINANPTGYPFDAAADLWDWIFQENCFSTLIRVSWPYWYVESLHRYALARQNGVPSMSLFYPDREDSYYFTWALAQSWGQMLTVTPEGYDLSSIEKKYRSFEKKYGNVYLDQQKISPFAVLFSLDNAYYVKKQKHTAEIFGIGEGCYLSNLPIDMVFDDATLAVMQQYALIFLPNLVMMSEDLGKRLRNYVEQGGILFVIGMVATKSTDGTNRDPMEATNLLGIKSIPVKMTPETGDYVFNYGDRYEKHGLNGQSTGYEFLEGEGTPFVTCNGRVAGIKETVGKGLVYWLPGGLSLDVLYPANADRFRREEVRVTSPDNRTKEIKKAMEAMMVPFKYLLPVYATNMPEEIVMTVFRSFDGRKLVLHLLDTKGAIPEQPEKIAHSDLIPSFVAGYHPHRECLGSIVISDRYPVSNAYLITPEKDAKQMLAVAKGDKGTVLSVPPDWFASYATIVCELDEPIG